MGRILMSIAGPWTEAPALRTGLDLEFGPADPDLSAVIESVGRRGQAVDDRDVSAIQRHRGVVGVEVEFDAPGDHTRARQAAQLLVDAFDAGAAAAYVETAVKVFAAGAMQGVSPNDPVVLYHLFVEVWGDAAQVCTEGMQAFDLPDVSVRYTASDVGPAQAAAFGLAARMVCDGEQPTEGERYRPSESAPTWLVTRCEAHPDAGDDPYANSRGVWVLERA